jgi:glycosyltransferase involved in cell wall biosynthesis
MWRRFRARPRWLQPAVTWEANRVERYERSLLSAFDRVVTLSNLDTQRLCRLDAGLPADHFTAIGPVVDSLAGPGSWDNTPPRLLFVGTLSWAPNVQGLESFLSSAWPVVARRFPQAELLVVGGGLSPAVGKRWATVPGVRLLGFVDDLGPMYSACRAFAAPIVGGSGVKIKILHAMARGLPVVTTPDGAEGIDVSREVLLQYEDANQLVRHLERIWDQPAAWQKASDASRTEVIAHYGRDRAHAAWSRLLRTVAAQPARRAAAVPLFKRRDAA